LDISARLEPGVPIPGAASSADSRVEQLGQLPPAAPQEEPARVLSAGMQHPPPASGTLINQDSGAAGSAPFEDLDLAELYQQQAPASTMSMNTRVWTTCCLRT
jgi:hypothetical protein